MIKKFLLALSAVILLSSNASACIKHLEVSDVWARSSSAPNHNSAAYMVIKNTSNKDMIITGAETDVAGSVELHETFLDEKGIHKMTHVDKIVVPAQSEIKLKPKHTHIMLMNLNQDLKAGEKFKLTLKVGEAGNKELDVVVKPLGK